MLVALRKHTKTLFWLIIVLIVPAFIFFWVPQAFRQSGPNAKYGSAFGKTVTYQQFGDVYRADGRMLLDLAAATSTMAYRLPQNRVLATMREALMADAGFGFDPAGEWRERPQWRELLESYFTNPETGRFDKFAYDTRRRELGMTDEEFLDAFKNDRLFMNYFLSRLLDPEDTVGQEYRRRFFWRRLVLAHEAERLGIPVSDQDVINYLYFKFPGEAGHVDQDRYNDILRLTGLKRVDYENELRTTIRIATLLRTVLDSAHAPPGEAAESFDDLYRTYKVAYHFEPDAPYADPEALREDEVLKWYADNRDTSEAVKIERRVAVLYVLVEAKDFEGDVAVDDAEVKTYYEAHPDEFIDAVGKPEPLESCRDEVRAAVVRSKAMAKAADEATTLFAVTRTSDRLVAAVEQANADPEAARRYELRATPLFGVEGPIDETIAEDEKDFRNQAFALDLAEVNAGPVRVKQGWCVLSPVRIEPDPTPGAKDYLPFYMVRGEARLAAAVDRVKPEIIDAYREQYKAVRRLMDEEGLGFVAACEHEDIALTTTGFLGVNTEEVPGLDDDGQLILRASQDREAAKQIEEGALEPDELYVFQANDGAVLYGIIETREPSPAFRAREMPWFAQSPARRQYVSLTYREWIDALESRAGIVDLQKEALDRQRQQQQQARTAGGAAR